MSNPANIPGWNQSTNNLWCYPFQTTAVVSGSPASVQLLQDYKGTITIGYADGSSTSLQIANYMPDVIAATGSTPYVSSTDAQGNVTCTLTDQPQLPITSGAMKVITSIQRTGSARDFVIVQYGSGSQTVVAESDWNFAQQATFTPQSPPFNSKPLASAGTSSPVTGGTTSGGSPAQPPPAWPRSGSASANAFTTNASNWVISGTGQDAANNKYPLNF